MNNPMAYMYFKKEFITRQLFQQREKTSLLMTIHSLFDFVGTYIRNPISIM